MKALVLQAFTEDEGYEGIAVADVQRFLSRRNVFNKSAAAIQYLVDELASDGCIFSTVDHHHWAATR